MTTLTLNKLKSTIGFSIRHMRVSTVTGYFHSFRANIHASSLAQLAASDMYVEIDVASISTMDNDRDQHLISADFFDADRFPKIYFTKTNMQQTNQHSATLIGDLTIKGITQCVTFDVLYKGSHLIDGHTEVHAFSCATTINRKHFGLTYNALIEANNIIIDENVNIFIDIELLG